MKRSFLLLLTCCAVFHCMAQDSIPPTTKKYNVTAFEKDGKQVAGWLLHITDTALVLHQTRTAFGSTSGQANKSYSIGVSDIEHVTIRSSGAAGRGFGHGMIVGAVSGAIIGLLSGDDETGFVRFSAGQKALGAAIVLAPVGGLAGLIIGSLAKKTFVINGRQQKLNEMRIRVMDMTYKPL